MKAQSDDIHQRLGFIDETIFHALRACWSDASVPNELKEFIQLLGQRSWQARQALRDHDVRAVRQSIADLVRISREAQGHIHAADGTNYELKSAVILTHIEVSALQHQLD
jgi:hypothetical protein